MMFWVGRGFVVVHGGVVRSDGFGPVLGGL